MNFVKKILLIHGDEKVRRTLTLLVAGAGYDVRACGKADAAIEAARSEWFDLTLVADPVPDASSFDIIAALRKIQPSVPVLLLVDQLELPSVIKGIRLAVSDVLAPEGDWAMVVQRVNALLRPGEAPAPVDLTPEELAEVEAILARFDAHQQTAGDIAGRVSAPEAMREELQRLTRERDDFKRTAERLAGEKTALEAELKAHLVRQDDAVALEADRAALRSEREVVAAAQAAVDEKARALATAREELARERAALAAERTPGMTPDQEKRLKSMEEIAREREMLEDFRLDLRAADVRQREDEARLGQTRAQLEADRRRLQEDVDLLREQEANLRAYEQRLRSFTVEAEADRVRQVAPRPSRDPFARDPSLEEAWYKVNRATDLLEAERRNFTDEKLAFAEEKARLEEWAAGLQVAQDALAQSEQQASDKASKRSFTHQPFKTARAILTGQKK